VLGVHVCKSEGRGGDRTILMSLHIPPGSYRPQHSQQQHQLQATGPVAQRSVRASDSRKNRVQFPAGLLPPMLGW
jgi:hypothetical protein